MKKNICKKIASAILLFSMMLTFTVGVMAYERQSPNVSPRWTSIHNIDLDMQFFGDEGLASGGATKQQTSSMIEGTLRLYKQVNNEWVCIGEWYKSKTIGSLVISATFACESGTTYKCQFTVTAYTNGVPETEIVECIQTCP